MTAAPRRTAVISRRPMIMRPASTSRAGRGNTAKFDDGPASPSAGPMFDMALITPDAAVTGSAPSVETTSVPTPKVMMYPKAVPLPDSTPYARNVLALWCVDHPTPPPA